jgi:hypothetical protein
MIIVATKNGRPKKICPLSSFGAVIGSGFLDPKSGISKIRIRDKHPLSATLAVRVMSKKRL